MMSKQTINKSKEVVYVALNFATGLTDLTLTVRKPGGTLVTPAPVFVEQGGGIYTATYTPDAAGSWQERVASVANGDDVVRAYDVVNFDADDVKVQTDSIETKVDTVDGKVDAVQLTADSIETKVDNISNSVNPGGYFA